MRILSIEWSIGLMFFISPSVFSDGKRKIHIWRKKTTTMIREKLSLKNEMKILLIPIIRLDLLKNRLKWKVKKVWLKFRSIERVRCCSLIPLIVIEYIFPLIVIGLIFYFLQEFPQEMEKSRLKLNQSSNELFSFSSSKNSNKKCFIANEKISLSSNWTSDFDRMDFIEKCWSNFFHSNEKSFDQKSILFRCLNQSIDRTLFNDFFSNFQEILQENSCDQIELHSFCDVDSLKLINDIRLNSQKYLYDNDNENDNVYRVTVDLYQLSKENLHYEILWPKPHRNEIFKRNFPSIDRSFIRRHQHPSEIAVCHQFFFSLDRMKSFVFSSTFVFVKDHFRGEILRYLRLDYLILSSTSRLFDHFPIAWKFYSIEEKLIRCTKYRFDRIIPTRWTFLLMEFSLSFSHFFSSFIFIDRIVQEKQNRMTKILQLIDLRSTIFYFLYSLKTLILLSLIDFSISGQSIFIDEEKFFSFFFFPIESSVETINLWMDHFSMDFFSIFKFLFSSIKCSINCLFLFDQWFENVDHTFICCFNLSLDFISNSFLFLFIN